MADYYTPTVFQEAIPNVDMTPLERLLLSNIFESEEDGGRTYFFSEEGPSDFVWLKHSELRVAWEASRGSESQMNGFIEEQLNRVEPGLEEIKLDMSATSWEFILQDIVGRSSTLRYIAVTAGFTCSKMRSDGFGGMALFITADVIKGHSTTEFLSDCLAEIISEDREG